MKLTKLSSKLSKPKKLSLAEMIVQADNAKKVNPLDLSSDQDLSVALMNLISLEEHFFFSGAKTKKNSFYDFVNTVHEMRTELMQRIIPTDNPDSDAKWNMSGRLLATSMRLIEVGTKALSSCRVSDAYKFFDYAYELYSLFWGINMGLIDISDVQHIAPDVIGSTFDVGRSLAQHHAKSVCKQQKTVQQFGMKKIQ